MKNYKPKKLIEGHLINKSLAGKTLIALKEGKEKDMVKVEYQNEFMYVDKTSTVLAKSVWFKDKFGGADYRLNYYEWKAVKEPLQISLL